MTLVFLFSGQGSQYYQMGAQLFAQDAAYREAFERCAALAGPVKGRGLVEIVFSRPAAESEGWDDQVEAGLALFAQGYATAQALIARGVRPDALAGYSLGEKMALALAEAASLGEMLALVRAESLHSFASAPEAALVSILASPRILTDDPTLTRFGEVACINSPQNFVMACPLDALEPFGRALDRRDITWVKVPVRRGFHSSLIEAAEPGYAELAADIDFREPRLPIYSSLTAARLRRIEPDHFWRLARGQVRFAQLVSNLWTALRPTFVDLSPGGSLAAFVRQQIGPEAPAYAVMNPAGRDVETMERAVRALKARG